MSIYNTNCLQIVKLERSIKMAEKKNMKLTSLHEHIKNTSICGVILTENQLETGRKTSITTAVKKKDPHESGRKGRQVIRSGSVTLGGDMEEDRSIMGSEILLEE